MRRLRILGLTFCAQLVLLTCWAAQQATVPPQQPVATAAAPTLPVAEQIRKTVGFLMVAYRNAGVQGGVIGTCFFVVVPDERLGKDQGFGYLVTNRHVAQPGIDLGSPYQVDATLIRMNLVTPVGGIQSVQEQILLNDGRHWFFPSNESVDLAILNIAPDLKKYAYMTIPASMIVSSEQLKSGEVGVGDPVSFAGYFSNFPGQIRIEPIVREGVIAMLPDEELDTTLHKKGRLFLADLHAFHGNSGSPVFVNVGGFHRGNVSAGERYLLLGVISGYYPESAGFSVPAATILTGEVRDNSGIATIVPAEELTKLLNSPAVKADRDSQVANLTKKP